MLPRPSGVLAIETGVLSGDRRERVHRSRGDRASGRVASPSSASPASTGRASGEAARGWSRAARHPLVSGAPGRHALAVRGYPRVVFHGSLMA